MTPLKKYPELAKALGVSDLYFKREDLHPFGSHKGRSIPIMIDHYYQNGNRQFAISSSGNAALAAALYIQEINSKNSQPAELDIFVGRHIAPHKLEKLKTLATGGDTINRVSTKGDNNPIRVLIKERPLQALTEAIQEGKRSLRQSTDDTALLGYESLAKELAEVKGIGAVFIGTSSGTTAQALAEYFLKEKLPIQVHIVQTSSCHPMSAEFENYDGPDEDSVADAIVDQTALRRTKLVPLIKKTSGYAWVASNDNIETALSLTEKNTGLQISTNSALSVAGVAQAIYRSWEIKGGVVCLICGE